MSLGPVNSPGRRLRLHFVALLVADLAGAYNDYGSGVGSRGRPANWKVDDLSSCWALSSIRKDPTPSVCERRSIRWCSPALHDARVSPRRPKRSQHPITGVLEQMTPPLPDHPPQGLIVLGQPGPHRHRLVLPFAGHTGGGLPNASHDRACSAVRHPAPLAERTHRHCAADDRWAEQRGQSPDASRAWMRYSAWRTNAIVDADAGVSDDRRGAYWRRWRAVAASGGQADARFGPQSQVEVRFHWDGFSRPGLAGGWA